MEREYKIGDRVRIRALEDMKREYGVDDCGDIPVRSCFTPSMQRFCGRTATISAIGDSGVVSLYDWSDSAGTAGWEFSTDMLEPVEPNYMEQVAKMFGVELGQEFEIEGADYNPHNFVKDGLFDCEGDPTATVLTGLLTGRNKIKQLICSCCGGTKEVVEVDETPICTQCARDVLAAWEQ